MRAKRATRETEALRAISTGRLRRPFTKSLVLVPCLAPGGQKSRTLVPWLAPGGQKSRTLVPCLAPGGQKSRALVPFLLGRRAEPPKFSYPSAETML